MNNLLLISFSLLMTPAFAEDPAPPPTIVDSLDLEPVWAGHRVPFALLTHKDHQFAAYYDADRRMTVAARRLTDRAWTFQKLDSTTGWDSHNALVLAIDRHDHLHLSGNMHVVPLIYFRSTRPLDVTSLVRVPHMTGQDESRVTYPRFFHAPDGALLYMYRDGSSGNGRRFLNRYDEATATWTRYFDTPLLDGTARNVNAYPSNFIKGPDGFFHLVWMWRETPDCRSNFHLSYARSRDLKAWQTAAGQPLTLPITPDNLDVVVDPTPPNAGLINTTYGIGFDAQSRPIIHYHNYDKTGNSQIYLARWENDAWKIRQVSQWDYRWAFEGGGSINSDLGAGPVELRPDGKLAQSFSHTKHGSGQWIIDSDSLQVIDTQPPPPTYPPGLTRPEGTFPGLGVRIQADSGQFDSRYILRWETLGSNRDKPREGPLPPPSMLRLYQLSN